MNRRDQELLEKQLHGLTVAPRNDGVMILAIIAVFLAGITLGGFLFTYTDEPVQIAANDVTTGAMLSHRAPQISEFQ